jgi:hypothetical protein
LLYAGVAAESKALIPSFLVVHFKHGAGR